MLILAAAGLLLSTEIGQGVLFLAAIHFATVAIHEGGHLMAALRLRYRVSSVRIGPFEQRWGYGRRRWSCGRMSLGGHVEASPPDYAYAPGREAIFIAAGPLANLAAAVALYGLSAAIELLPASGFASSLEDRAGGVMEALAAWSALQGAYNLVPFRTRRHTSDGAHLLELFRRARALRRRY